MDTLNRPDTRLPSVRVRELLAYALLIAGFIQIVLGIYEIGGLFNVGVGLAVLWAGALTALADMTRRRQEEEEEFFRIADDF